MQAQRKFDQPSPSAAPAPDATSFSWTPRIAVPRARPTPPSPAHLMWDELATRLQDQPSPGALTLTDLAEPAKWPMPVRLATILGLSAFVWGAIAIAALAII